MKAISMLIPKQNGCCLLVEDQTATREFLEKTLLAAFPDSKTVATSTLKEARTCLDQLQSFEHNTPLKLALVDLGLPDGSGIDLVRYLAQHYPEVPSVVVSIYEDDVHLFGALAAGAYGYILKDDDPPTLVELLQRIQQGEPPLSPAIARRLIANFRRPRQPPENGIALTSREQETLTLIAQGLTVAEAAERMGLSAQTVAGYVKIIYQKLHLSNRADATREAVRRGLV